MGGVGSGAKPKNYPPELVARVAQLYGSGLTMREVAAEVGCSYRVLQRLMPRHGIARRPAIKRDQSGPKNHAWKGSAANYQALHLRVDAARGKPNKCDRCWTTDADRVYEWANLTGRYDDIDDYERMCRHCHRSYDAERRARTGHRTSPQRRGSGVMSDA